MGAADRLRARKASLLIGLALVATVFGGLLAGSVAIGLGDIWHMIQIRTCLTDDPERLTDSVLWAIRLPRVLAGLVVGAGLGVAGVALQG